VNATYVGGQRAAVAPDLPGGLVEHDGGLHAVQCPVPDGRALVGVGRRRVASHRYRHRPRAAAHTSTQPCIPRGRLCDPMLSRFGRTPTFDRQTDTDRHTRGHNNTTR